MDATISAAQVVQPRNAWAVGVGVIAVLSGTRVIDSPFVLRACARACALYAWYGRVSYLGRKLTVMCK